MLANMFWGNGVGDGCVTMWQSIHTTKFIYVPLLQKGICLHLYLFEPTPKSTFMTPLFEFQTVSIIEMGWGRWMQASSEAFFLKCYALALMHPLLCAPSFHLIFLDSPHSSIWISPPSVSIILTLLSIYSLLLSESSSPSSLSSPTSCLWTLSTLTFMSHVYPLICLSPCTIYLVLISANVPRSHLQILSGTMEWSYLFRFLILSILRRHVGLVTSYAIVGPNYSSFWISTLPWNCMVQLHRQKLFGDVSGWKPPLEVVILFQKQAQAGMMLVNHGWFWSTSSEADTSWDDAGEPWVVLKHLWSTRWLAPSRPPRIEWAMPFMSSVLYVLFWFCLFGFSNEKCSLCFVFVLPSCSDLQDQLSALASLSTQLHGHLNGVAHSLSLSPCFVVGIAVNFVLLSLCSDMTCVQD